MGEEEARELLRHFLATIPDHRLSELEDGNMIVFEEYLFDSDDQSINDEHTRKSLISQCSIRWPGF